MAQMSGGGGGINPSDRNRSRNALGLSAPNPNPRPGQGQGYGVVAPPARSSIPNLPAPSRGRSSSGGGRSSGSSGGGRSSGGGGGGGIPRGGGGGGGVGSNSAGHISHVATPAAPAIPSMAAFTAKDSAYQSQVAALKKALADYQAQQGLSKTQYLTGYGTDLNTLKQNRTQGLSDLENDYASRGLLQSGLYADSMSDLNKDYDTKQSALDQAKAAYLAQLSSDFTNFSSEQQLTQQRALQDAAARRAALYGA